MTKFSRTNTIQNLFFLLLFFSLGACAPGGTWVHQYKQRDQFVVDDINCARYASSSTTNVQSTALSSILQKSSYASCMEALGWTKNKGEDLSDYNLSEKEKIIIGTWWSKDTQKDGLIATEIINILPDRTFSSELKFEEDQDIIDVTEDIKFPIFVSVEGDWIFSDDLKITLIDRKSTYPGFRAGDTHESTISHINSELIIATDGTVWHRMNSYQGFKSQQKLIPTLGNHHSAGSTGSSSISNNSNIRNNAYGPGIHSDQYGRAIRIIPANPGQSGYYGDSIIKQENGYGYGIHMDQYGRPVKTAPY